MIDILNHFFVGLSLGWLGMNAIRDENERINSGFPAICLAITLVLESFK